jgi:hypothetical protein
MAFWKVDLVAPPRPGRKRAIGPSTAMPHAANLVKGLEEWVVVMVVVFEVGSMEGGCWLSDFILTD